MDPQPAEQSFCYHPRRECICGSSLETASAEVLTEHPWGNVRFLRCPECRSWCQSPQIDTDSLALWYDSDSYQGSASHTGEIYDDYEADEAQRHAEANARFRKEISPFLISNRASILEIGCASASLLAVAQREGHAVTGIDLSERFAEQAKRLNGIEVIVGDFLDELIADETIDVVVLLGTISNLPDMPLVLKKIRRILRRDGFAIINFPDSTSWPARLYGSRFWMFAPSAVTFASEKGFKACALRSGFSIVRAKMDWQQPSMRKLLKHTGISSKVPIWVRSLLNSIRIPFRVPVPAVRLVWLRPA